MLFQGLWQDYTVILSFGYLFWSTVLFTEITAFITQQLTADHCGIMWERRILATTKKSQSSLEKFSKYYEIYVNVRPASFFLHCVYAAAAAAKSLQSCPTLCDPIDGSPWGSPVPGILQARTLEWVAIPSPVHESEKWKWSRSVVSDSLWPHGLQPTRLLCPQDSPGKNTGSYYTHFNKIVFYHGVFFSYSS